MRLAVSILVLHLSSGQIFPFSNLRAFFDPKKQPKDTPEQLPNPGLNVSRPYRQATDHGVILPPLDQFDSPDIFTINRDISQENQRVFPTRRIPSSTSPTVTRKKNSSRYRAQTEPPPEIYQPYQEDYETPVFITPRPNNDHNKFGSGEEVLVSKVKSKSRTRSRKPQHNQESVSVVEPIPYVSEEEPLDDFSLSSSNRQPIEVALAPDEPPLIENVPSIGVSIEEQEKYEEDPGLIDYLTPPKLPSVYEKARKRQKPRRQASLSKLKSPQPTQTLSKKDNRYRTKKHRNELKSTSVPRVERLTTAKRHISRRRPSPPRDIKKRKPSSEAITQLELQKQASQMDEQITAETGFSGAGSRAHAHLPSNERVEFQMHGQKGPHSYKFGYDTGKGHNRQFRYEEKDAHGRVTGHYGYYDKEGKLQMVNYEADPHTGFKTDTGPGEDQFRRK